MSDKQTPPPQHQEQRPGSEQKMHPQPVFISDRYQAAGKLNGKVAIITGGDSGIGRSVAVLFALPQGLRSVALVIGVLGIAGASLFWFAMPEPSPEPSDSSPLA